MNPETPVTATVGPDVHRLTAWLTSSTGDPTDPDDEEPGRSPTSPAAGLRLLGSFDFSQ